MQILLVDDDGIILEDLRRSIHWDKLGITQIHTALNASQARHILEDNSIDVIVCDIEMPKESGLELLRWYREWGGTGKFLLLTSFEKFEYATEAVRLRAEDYLMKPFQVKTMELALQKVIGERKRERAMEQVHALGNWMVANTQETRLAVWHQIISGTSGAGYYKRVEQLKGTPFELDFRADYRLVLLKATNLEEDYATYDRKLISFILTNMASDTFSETPENENVLCFELKDSFVLTIVCPDETDAALERKCLSLRHHLGTMLSATITQCILNPRKIEELSTANHHGRQLVEQGTCFYGEVFFENQISASSPDAAPILDVEQMVKLMDEGNKKEIMVRLKKALDARIRSGVLDEFMLKSIHREFQQAIYSHLTSRGIQITLLLDDRMSESILNKAEQSATDFLRCANHLLDRVFTYEKEIAQSRGLVDQINEYIHQHYMENIGRNEIGTAFYLVPEYLAKLYKKKTGRNLKDAINDYRLEQAKLLLRTTVKSVAEIAMAVGFDNISYFSTLFKKSTGITPLEYRRQNP